MKRIYIVTIDIDRDSVLTDDLIKENIEGTLESRFDEINVDRWNHKLITDVKVRELNNITFSDTHPVSIKTKVICIGNWLKDHKLRIYNIVKQSNNTFTIHDDINNLSQVVDGDLRNDFLELDSYNNIIKAATKLNIDAMRLLAAVIYDCQLDEVTNSMRQLAKASSFIEAYGGDSKSLEDML